MIFLVMASLVLWLAILALPWRPWDVAESLDADTTLSEKKQKFPAVTVLIPARDEGEVITETLNSLAIQDPDLKIVLIDDQSTDDTVLRARSVDLSNLQILSGKPLPEGWSGKLWALEQGLKFVETDLVLLLDADIMLKPGILNALKQKLEYQELDFVSLMAQLNMTGFWEKLLMPAFIHFFKLLYPFKLSNNNHPMVAAAAGGCILVKRQALEEVGAFGSLRSALIDDCSLAKQLRKKGRKTWVGLTHSVLSLRSYSHLRGIWSMVSRTAYTQLRYSPLLLILCTLLMTLAYLIPLFAIGTAPLLALLIVFLMFVIYRPTVEYYNLPVVWTLTLPLAGILYLLMTWWSAIAYYRGQRSYWKGRSYGS